MPVRRCRRGLAECCALATGGHITYKDDAIDREHCRRAIEKGAERILKTQVRVNGELTAW